MIPYDVTPTQLAWHVLAGGDLSQKEEGRCRICGGALVGEAQPVRPRDNWMEEHQCREKGSDLECSACTWALSNRNLLSQSLKRARLISPSRGLVDYTDDRVEELLAEMRRGFEPPYLFFVRQGRVVYRRHVILESAVSWSRHGYVTLVSPADNFAFPVSFARLADAVEELLARRKAQPRFLPWAGDPFWRAALALALAMERNQNGKGEETE